MGRGQVPRGADGRQRVVAMELEAASGLDKSLAVLAAPAAGEDHHEGEVVARRTVGRAIAGAREAGIFANGTVA